MSEDFRDRFGRLASSPERLDWLTRHQAEVDEALRHLTAQVAGIEAAISALALDRERDREARDGELEGLRAQLWEITSVIRGSVAGHAAVTQRVSVAEARRVEHERLCSELGTPPELREGLSVLTICWNHGGFLAEAISSGLAVLDHLGDDAGEVLVLDDASVDETAAVADQAAADDDRVRVIHARENLGLARARNTLLATCGTTHAFSLDADNTAQPDGVAALWEVARRYRPGLCYGPVVKVEATGAATGIISNEPVGEDWFAANYVDTMAVIDVAVLRWLGGWPTDPVVEHVDDWAMAHSLARVGAGLCFVPVRVGTYRDLAGAFHRGTPDLDVGPARVRRTWNPDNVLNPGTVAAYAVDPDLGMLWSTPAAEGLTRRRDAGEGGAPTRSDPTLSTGKDGAATPGVAGPGPGPRVLVVGPGGVGNLGDDAIVVAGLDRLRRLTPDAAVDLVTDGDRPAALPPRTTWRTTLLEAVRALPVPAVADPARAERLAAAAATAHVGTCAWSAITPSDYDMAVLLGGGTLTSLWGDTLVGPRALLAAHLEIAGVPLVASGQGVGPLQAPHEAWTADIADNARAISTRDPASAELLGRLAPKATIATTGDDALGLDPPPAALVAGALRRAGVGDRYLVVTTRSGDYVGPEEAAWWATTAGTLADAADASVLGLALNDREDADELGAMVRTADQAIRAGSVATQGPWALLEVTGDPRLATGVLAGAQGILTTSYHAALLALARGVPALMRAATPYYEAKVAGLAALTGMDTADLVASPGDEPVEVAQRLDRVRTAIVERPLRAATDAVDRWWADQLAGLRRNRVSG